MSSLRKLISRLVHGKPSDVDLLIRKASQTPRYQEMEIQFRNYQLRVTDFISVAYQLKEYFGDERMSFDPGKKNPRIIDCGANVGVSVLYFKKQFPEARITAFEPDPKIHACIATNLKNNKISDIELHQSAVWINNEGIAFGSEGADGGSVFFEGNKQVLPSVRLKELLEQEEEIDLLKMDIEGAEVAVLSDCAQSLSKVHRLFVEYHAWTGQKQELDQLLKVLTEAGFRYRIESIGEHIRKPFAGFRTSGPMDVQLDIYAINEAFEK